MSKSLNTIQKCVRVFYTLTGVGTVLSVVGMVFALVAVVLWGRWNSMPTQGIGAMERLMQYIDQGTYVQTMATLVAEAIACAFGAALLWFARNYLGRELADGTPFTEGGATQLRHLGILTIVLPIVSIALQIIPYQLLDAAEPRGMDNGSSVILGVVLILASVVFRYGAEIAGGAQSEEMM